MSIKTEVYCGPLIEPVTMSYAGEKSSVLHLKQINKQTNRTVTGSKNECLHFYLNYVMLDKQIDRRIILWVPKLYHIIPNSYN